MRTDLPTVSELASYLKNSSLPTLLVEGSDDVVYLKSIEHIVDGINILPAGGKSEVLSLYEQDASFGCLVLYFVDMDNWVYTGIPENYSAEKKFQFTNGYSLENDLISDSKIVDTLMPDEKQDFELSLSALCNLMASCIDKERHERFDYGKKLSCAFALSTKELSKEALDYMGRNPAVDKAIEFVSSDPLRFYRGKTITQILSLMLSRRKGRRALDVRSFFESVWVQRDTNMERVVQSIRENIAAA